VEVARDPDPPVHASVADFHLLAIALLALLVADVLPRPAHPADSALAEFFVDLNHGWDHFTVASGVPRRVPDAVTPGIHLDCVHKQPEAFMVEQIRVDLAEHVAQPTLIGGPRQPARERSETCDLNTRPVLRHRLLRLPDHRRAEIVAHV